MPPLATLPERHVSAEEQRFSVLTWNISVAAFESEHKMRQVLEVLSGCKCDAYLLQEVMETPQRHPLRYLADELGLLGHFGRSAPKGGKGTRWQGNMILSPHSFSTKPKEAVLHQKSALVPMDEKRTYAEATLATKPKQFTVGCTHLSFNLPPAPLGLPPVLNRTKPEMQALAGHVRQRSRYVLGGDLNVKPGAKELQFLTDELQMCGSPATVPTCSWHALESRLDYVLCSKDLQETHSKTLQSPASDHRALVVGFQLSP